MSCIHDIALCLASLALQVWDGVSNRCIATFQEAHNKQPVGAFTAWPCAMMMSGDLNHSQVSTVRVSKNTKVRARVP